MPALAITGVVGSGKSEVLKRLESRLGATVFSADAENRRLLDEDFEVKQRIISRFGPSSYLPDGKTDRNRLFELISNNPESREDLEQILHPLLEALWKPLAERHKTRPEAFFVAEIPLLLEKQLQSFFDITIVVGCSQIVRTRRLEEHRSLSPEQAVRWAALQHPQDFKIAAANHLLWNDGSLNSLHLQVDFLVAQLLSR
mgnify:CR=1 FL=1